MSDITSQVRGALGIQSEPESPEPEQDVAEVSSPVGEETPDDLNKKSANRFQKLVNENKVLKDEQASQKRELETLRELKEKAKPYEDEAQLDAVLNAAKPKGFKDWDDDRKRGWEVQQFVKAQYENRPVAAQSAVTAEIEAERKLFKDTGSRDWSQSQIEALLDTRESAPGINGEELVTLTVSRHPDLFESGLGKSSLEKVPQSHLVQEPRASRKNQQPKTRRQQINDDFHRAHAGGNKQAMKAATVADIKDQIWKD